MKGKPWFMTQWSLESWGGKGSCWEDIGEGEERMWERKSAFIALPPSGESVLVGVRMQKRLIRAARGGGASELDEERKGQRKAGGARGEESIYR